MATEIIANEAEIKEAMTALRLGGWVDDLLDEIELNRRLKISLEQDDKGMTRPTAIAVKEILADLKNGRL